MITGARSQLIVTAGLSITVGVILVMSGLRTPLSTAVQHEDNTTNRRAPDSKAADALVEKTANVFSLMSNVETMRFPRQYRYERLWSRRDVAKYPRLAECFDKLRQSMHALEKARIDKVTTRVTGVWKVIAFRIPESTINELQPIYDTLSRIGRTAGSDVERKIIQEETDIFIYEYLRYPNPSRVVVTSTNMETGKTRLIEVFLPFDDRPLLNDQGGMIRYGNDFPSGDDDAFCGEESWASTRYSILKSLIFGDSSN